MKTLKSFLNKSECTKIAKKIREISPILGGIEDENLCLVISSDDAEHIATQFDIHAKRNGEFFCNIIKESHYSSIQIKSILRLL